MKVQSRAAWYAGLSHLTLLAICLLLFPVLSQAKAKVTHGFEKRDLVTTNDFVEYAAIHEVDIHDLFFSLRPYEGTQSCLTCHESEGLEMLTTGHFKWEGYTDRIVGLEGQSHGKRDLINNFCVQFRPTNHVAHNATPVMVSRTRAMISPIPKMLIALCATTSQVLTRKV